MKEEGQIPIEVTFRHLGASDALRARAEKKISSLLRMVPGATDAHVVLSGSSGRKEHRAEVVVNGAKSHLAAHAEAVDLYAAIDQMAAKLDHQVRSLKGKVVGSPRRKSAALRAEGPVASSGQDG